MMAEETPTQEHVVLDKEVKEKVTSKVLNDNAASKPSAKEEKEGNTPQLDSAEQSLNRVLALLRTKNDTSRFVGLALLKSILDLRQELRQDRAIVTRCWEAIPPRFLDRLLRAEQNEMLNKAEARSMMELAVAILHVFIVLLPPEKMQDPKLLGRIPGLILALSRSSSTTASQAIQVLLTLSTTSAGACAVLFVPDWSPLVELAYEHPLVLDVFKYAFFLASTRASRQTRVFLSDKMDELVLPLMSAFRGHDPISLFQCLSDILPATQSLSVSSNSSKWLPQLAQRIHSAVPKSHSSDAPVIICLSAVLLQLYPSLAPTLLFQPSGSSPEDETKALQIFLKLLLIDIESTLPSLPILLQKSNNPSGDSQNHSFVLRRQASYEVLISFISYLISTCETTLIAGLSPSAVLQLRSDIGNTIAQTASYLLDQWNAFILPQDPSVQPRPKPDLTVSMTYTQLRTIHMWLVADANEKFITSTTSLMPLLLFLLRKADITPQRRRLLLNLMYFFLDSENGPSLFQTNNGWDILFPLLSTTATSSTIEGFDLEVGLDIIRNLLRFAESEAFGPTPETWLKSSLDIVVSGSRCAEGVPTETEFRIALGQLAVELLDNAYWGAKVRAWGKVDKMVEFVKKLSGEGVDEVVSGVDEIHDDLKSLGKLK